MPNWVTNHLTITGPNAEQVVIDITNEAGPGEIPSRELDFNKIIPMPESLKVPAGSITNAVISAYLYKNKELHTKKLETSLNNTQFFGRFDVREHDEDTYQKLIENYCNKEKSEYSPSYTEEEFMELGKQLLDNLEQYGCLDWYGWSNANWGTKWNARTILVENNIIIFETAWSDVRDLICKLSEKYPENHFEYMWAEEQIGNYVGRATFHKGAEIEMIDYEDWSKEAYEQAFDLVGGEDMFEFDEEMGTYKYIEEVQNEDEGEM